MAGAGYKLFQTGDVLTAAQVNTYLNEQTVMVFANAAARTSALTSVLAEGMVSYLQDTNAVEVYNGTAWVGVSGAGDVTEVQAGTGISVASGTGPIPIVTSTVATTFDAKGDLVVGTGADTFAKLTAGTNTYILTADSAEATGLKWAAPAGGGKVLQVVQDTDTSGFSTASTTFQDTGLSVTITPSSASSKVLITVAGINAYVSHSGSQTSASGAFRLVRTSTQLQYTNIGALSVASSSGPLYYGNPNFGYLDSPATTSATTYKVQGKCEATYATTCAYSAAGDIIASIVAYEIGA